MTPERWQQVKAIAAEALDRAPAERAQFVAAACATDEDLRSEILSLLEADDPTGRFLELDLPPERVGPWRLVREIGRGGMGTVYLAERADGQFEQRVAVKIVTRGMDSAAVIRRFHAERRMLARLEHPNIARLFDGGVTLDGRPYFVMGTWTAALRRLLPRASASGRAEDQLFVALCEAVEHAHRQLVLHRDIKAANVLVDERGVPRLVDFGIARLLDAEGAPGASPTGSVACLDAGVREPGADARRAADHGERYLRAGTAPVRGAGRSAAVPISAGRRPPNRRGSCASTCRSARARSRPRPSRAGCAAISTTSS